MIKIIEAKVYATIDEKNAPLVLNNTVFFLLFVGSDFQGIFTTFDGAVSFEKNLKLEEFNGIMEILRTYNEKREEEAVNLKEIELFMIFKRSKLFDRVNKQAADAYSVDVRKNQARLDDEKIKEAKEDTCTICGFPPNLCPGHIPGNS